MTSHLGNHLMTSSELMVLSDTRQEFVPITLPMTCATRLRILMNALNGLGQASRERDALSPRLGAMDKLNTLKFMQWTLMDDDRKLLLAVTFDLPLEAHLRIIVDVGGPLPDVILCPCEDYAGRSTVCGFEGCLCYARQYQVPVELFTAADPGISVTDAHALEQVGGLPEAAATWAKRTLRPPSCRPNRRSCAPKRPPKPTRPKPVSRPCGSCAACPH